MLKTFVFILGFQNSLFLENVFSMEKDKFSKKIIKNKKIKIFTKKKNISKNQVISNDLLKLLSLLFIPFIASKKISRNYWKKSPDINFKNSPDLKSKSESIDDLGNLDDLGQKKYLFNIVQSHIKEKYPNLRNKEIWFLVTNPDEYMADEIVFFEKEDKAPDGLCWLHSVNLSKDFERLCHAKVKDIQISKFLIYYFTKNKQYIQQLPPNVQDVFNYIFYYKHWCDNMPMNSLTNDEKNYFLILNFLLDDMYGYFSDSVEEYIESKKINKEEISEYMEDINEISQEKDYFIKIKKIKTFFDKNKDKLKNNSFQLNCFPDEDFIKSLSSSIIKNRFWGDQEDIEFFVQNLLDQELIMVNSSIIYRKRYNDYIFKYDYRFNSNFNFIPCFKTLMKKSSNYDKNQFNNEEDAMKFILEKLNPIISISNGIDHYDSLIYGGSFKLPELDIFKKISLTTTLYLT